MKKQILIDYSETLIRLAVISEGYLTHLYIEDPLNEDMQNKIIQGQVCEVVKNLKAAFVDFGEEKKGLLHFSQIPPEYMKKMNSGIRLPVQIVRENIGKKGHKLTSFINIPGNYLICLPFEQSIGISRQITDKALRDKLKKWLSERAQGKYGFIVRTQAQEVPMEILEHELEELIRRTEQLMQMKECVSKGTLLLEEPPFYIQLMREHIGIQDEVEIVCNEKSYLEAIEKYFEHIYQNLSFKYYEATENIFSIYSIEKAYEETLKQKIWLKNGGNIVIEYTEAMTVIDVNSAKAVQKKNASKTIWELNTLAAKEAIRQMILRNLGGIILIDLVEFADKRQITDFNAFIAEYVHQIDRARSTVYPVTELGLLQIARTKKYTPLHQKIYTQCNQCYSAHSSYTPAYNAFLIEQKVKQTGAHTIHKQLYVTCSLELADFLSRERLCERFEKRYHIRLEVIKNENQQHFEIHHHV